MNMYVAADHQRCTTIVVGKADGAILFIPLSYDNGLQVESLPAKEFAGIYSELADYPVERAATLYVQYAHSIGASTEALDYLGQIIKLTSKDIEMATKTPAAKTAKKTPAAKAAPEKTAKAGKTVAATKAPAAKKAPAEKKDRGPSAASRFKELIMAGELTDDKIFAKVQKEFGLDDSKRSYVAWYRKDLVKKGMKVPKAKE